MQSETWKPVVDWEGCYEVSSHGLVRSVDRVVLRNGIHRIRRRSRLLSQKSKNGYLEVNLWQSGKGTSIEVHRLVLNAFAGPCPSGYQCRHLNGKRSDNRVDNLRWGTVAENMADREAHGKNHRGERHASAKLTDAQVRQVRAHTGSLTALARQFGVSKGALSLIRLGKRWGHVT